MNDCSEKYHTRYVIYKKKKKDEKENSFKRIQKYT